MVSFPPLLPSGAWFSDYLHAKSEGLFEEDALGYANNRLLSSKDFGRFVLKNSQGENIRMSLALAGGGKQLRNTDTINDLKLSEHGDWRKVHLGAIEACLGRKPFYRHLEEPLVKVYNNRELTSIQDFNLAILEVLNSFLIGNIRDSQLKLLSADYVFKERSREIAEGIDKEISALQALAEYGKESLLGIFVLNRK